MWQSDDEEGEDCPTRGGSAAPPETAALSMQELSALWTLGKSYDVAAQRNSGCLASLSDETVESLVSMGALKRIPPAVNVASTRIAVFEVCLSLPQSFPPPLQLGHPCPLGSRSRTLR